NELKEMLSEAKSREHDSQIAYTRLDKQYQSLNDTYSVLEEHLKQEEGKLLQQSAELDLTRNSLKEQKSARDTLQGQLSEVYSRLERQRAEVTRLERVATTVPASFPIVEQTVGGSEAKEILGARDLHIVDVYDVDNA